MEIWGSGYRKCLEFVIKDYVIWMRGEEEDESIRNKFVNNWIREKISKMKIKRVGWGGVWVGNDERDYRGKWEDKDINELKWIIELRVDWIEWEMRREKVLEDMGELRWKNVLKMGYKFVG